MEKKNYDPAKIEKKWYSYWTERGYFTPQIEEEKQPYTILIPPPNVTNILHMGHVLNNTLQDVMIRYKRMTGAPTLWLPGVDHAGIATQNMVEKELKKAGVSRHDIGREKLIERIWQWKEEKGGKIIEQLKMLGCSCDWSRERFTMDEGLSEAVKEVFIRLYEKGLIYKGKRIINWCPRCVTALANDEVEHEDKNGKMWELKYPLKGKEGYVTVETTRPETMLGDTAIAVNPDDKRFEHLIGETVILPFIGREIPIIADEYVSMELGSGCVKITPAHDPNDYEVAQRHNLPAVVIMDEHAVMNENAGEQFIGLDRYECRKKLVEKLHKKGLLGKISEHQHSVGHCYRCDTAIEPYLSDQWFVKMEPLAKPAIKVVKEGKIGFQPERWTKVYLHWMENIRDWCISRQIWWGHRIPVYYCEICDEVVVAKSMPKSCPKCQYTKFRQDEDVLDTWFSSWLWPFSTLGWPQQTEDLNYFLPTDLLITAPEIIYLWVARMIMATMEFTGKIPFHTVLLHGTVRDEHGIKMSKSLGNSPDPIDIINEIGADALRFSMIFSTPKGQDSYYSSAILETGRNFANKIWNAYRFITMNAETPISIPDISKDKLELADKWIYSRLQSVITETKEQYESLRFNDAASLLMDFIWKEFCAWYLELCKDRIYNGNDEQMQIANYILLDILQISMRLLHPIMPFITEEIWQNLKEHLPQDEEALIVAQFPHANENLIDEISEKEMILLQEAISAIRNMRKQVNIPPGKSASIVIKTKTKKQTVLLKNYSHYLEKMAKVDEMDCSKTESKPPQSIASVVQNIEIYLPLRDLIDIEAEKAKLDKKIGKLAKDKHQVERKLNNDKFISKAPADVVEKEKQKYEEISTQLNILQKLVTDLTG
jgi:valyl-tRNA synthetase